MASLLEQFNAVQPKETLRTADLVEGKLYTLNKIVIRDTKYGQCAIATLLEEEEEIKAYLPQRYVSVFKEKETKFKNTKLVRGRAVGNSFKIKLIRK